MWYVIGGIGLLFIILMLKNGARNNDPLNRKCAADICEYLTSKENFEPIEIAEIFKENARYQAQANHITSMVPLLLMKAGYPRDAAMAVVPLLKSAVLLIPK
ncbi:MAG: hypothetical protein H6999_10205 [Hahellaceae bacterium]|nr:hypothetical protein [Hahellaceae bacterium]MCP5170114.1 hypothetical protein [Hahellaceae bacterium]